MGETAYEELSYLNLHRLSSVFISFIIPFFYIN